MPLQPKRGDTTTPPRIFLVSGDRSGTAPIEPPLRSRKPISLAVGTTSVDSSNESNARRFAEMKPSAYRFQLWSRPPTPKSLA